MKLLIFNESRYSSTRYLGINMLFILLTICTYKTQSNVQSRERKDLFQKSTVTTLVALSLSFSCYILYCESWANSETDWAHSWIKQSNTSQVCTLRPGSRMQMRMSWKNTNICPESSSFVLLQWKFATRYNLTYQYQKVRKLSIC